MLREVYTDMDNNLISVGDYVTLPNDAWDPLEHVIVAFEVDEEEWGVDDEGEEVLLEPEQTWVCLDDRDDGDWRNSRNIRLVPFVDDYDESWE